MTFNLAFVSLFQQRNVYTLWAQKWPNIKFECLFHNACSWVNEGSLQLLSKDWSIKHQHGRFSHELELSEEAKGNSAWCIHPVVGVSGWVAEQWESIFRQQREGLLEICNHLSMPFESAREDVLNASEDNDDTTAESEGLLEDKSALVKIFLHSTIG